MVEIRSARAGDGPELQRIERLAGEQFRSVGLDAVADDEPASVAELATYAQHGLSWVAVDDALDTVGYVLVGEVDGAALVEQVTVRPDHQGKGVGRELLERVRTWATETGKPWIVLTTFADVPWNRPLYEHLGFQIMSHDEIGPALREIQQKESTRSWGSEPRECMRRPTHRDAVDHP